MGSTCEINPSLRAIPSNHGAGLDYLCAHPACGLWYVFFDDLWTQNKEMAKFKKHEQVLSPASPGSICYSPMPKDELDRKLTELGIRAKHSLFTTRCSTPSTISLRR